MRRVICSIVLVVSLCVALVACSKDESNLLEVPSESIIVPNAGVQGTTTFDSRNITSLTPTSIPNGWTVDNIDMYKGTITVTAPASFDNEEVRRGFLHLKGYTPTGKTRGVSIFLAIAETIPFNDAANCYVATTPQKRYAFNPMVGGNGDVELATAEIKLLWQTSTDLVEYIDMRENENGAMEASFFIDEDEQNEGRVVAGNALIGAFNSAGEIIWSWHIWVTNNDPSKSAVELNDQIMMNVNLGAEHNSNGSTNGDDIYCSYGMYYQWGRKDPFIGPLAYNFPSNDDDNIYNSDGYRIPLEYVDSTIEQGTVEWATAHPMALIKGCKDNGYDWLYNEHNTELWSASQKSKYDPCPAGWRMPDSSLFANLTIAASDDDLAWSEAQKQYGFNLVVNTETEREYFFTAQGRRNYLDCRLDIFNADETLPVPWSGYYWTVTTAGTDAKALYFDLNTATRTGNSIDPSRSMQRANAMPVRCVRE